jgi:hypothetical protein
MRGRTVLLLVAVLSLGACESDDEFVDRAIAQARAACEAQGKQFILKSRPQVTSGELYHRDIQVEGACVGPDDPGYTPAGI